MSGADQFVDASWGPNAQRVTEFSGAVVQGVNADGTVDLRYLDEYHAGIDCLSSYTNRQSGDLVTIKSHGARWVVIGKVGSESEAIPNISWGTGNPVGSDWETSASVKVRPGQLYVQGTAFAADNFVTTPQAIIPLSSDRTFRSGIWDGSFSTRPAQGVDTSGLYGSGAFAGGWEYGTNLQVATAAKTVRRMELRLERGPELIGLDQPVSPKIYVHNETGWSGTTPSWVAGPYIGPALEIGQSVWWQVPQPVIDLLSANSAKGFGIDSDLADDFLVMADQSGDVRIYN